MHSATLKIVHFQVHLLSSDCLHVSTYKKSSTVVYITATMNCIANDNHDGNNK